MERSLFGFRGEKRHLNGTLVRKHARELKKLEQVPRFIFLPEKVVLKIGDEVVFSRSNVFMQVAQSGEDWKRQIGKELGAKGYPTPPSESMEPNLSTSTSHDQAASSSRRAGPNADHRKRLLEGSEFHCGERKEDRYGGLHCEGHCSL